MAEKRVVDVLFVFVPGTMHSAERVASEDACQGAATLHGGRRRQANKLTQRQENWQNFKAFIISI